MIRSTPNFFNLDWAVPGVRCQEILSKLRLEKLRSLEVKKSHGKDFFLWEILVIKYYIVYK